MQLSKLSIFAILGVLAIFDAAEASHMKGSHGRRLVMYGDSAVNVQNHMPRSALKSIYARQHTVPQGEIPQKNTNGSSSANTANTTKSYDDSHKNVTDNNPIGKISSPHGNITNTTNSFDKTVSSAIGHKDAKPTTVSLSSMASASPSANPTSKKTAENAADTPSDLKKGNSDKDANDSDDGNNDNSDNGNNDAGDNDNDDDDNDSGDGDDKSNEDTDGDNSNKNNSDKNDTSSSSSSSSSAASSTANVAQSSHSVHIAPTSTSSSPFERVTPVVNGEAEHAVDPSANASVSSVYPKATLVSTKETDASNNHDEDSYTLTLVEVIPKHILDAQKTFSASAVTTTPSLR